MPDITWFECGNGSEYKPKLFDKATVSNLATLALMVLGTILVVVLEVKYTEYILAFGLFGFAGGITNWLAVKMYVCVCGDLPTLQLGQVVRQSPAARTTRRQIMQ